METLFLIAGLIAYLIVIILVLIRLIKIRQGATYAIQPSILSIVEPRVDKLAYYLVISSREVFHYGYILGLLLVERIIKLIKYFVLKVEKRFAKIVNQVKGRGEITKKGAASLFLREIKDHQDKIKAELNIR